MLELLFGLQFVMVLIFLIKKFKVVYNIFRESERKQGIFYTIYLSTTTIFIFNPMDYERTTITSFKRIIGEGVINGYDCTRVTSNFTLRVIMFALFLVVYGLFMNYIKSLEYTPEQVKVWKFLDRFIVIAMVTVVLRGITYFYDASPDSESVFNHSFYLTALIILLSSAYIFLRLDRRIETEMFKRLMFGIICISYPVSIMLPTDWNRGRTQIIIQVSLCVFAVIFIKCCWKKVINKILLSDVSVLLYSLFPIVTSLYIELINVLNQHGVFVATPKRYYGILTLILCAVVLICNTTGKGYCIHGFTTSRVYPLLAVGIAMLAYQVPLQKNYAVNLMETANKSILISDFLNFGSIPIVEHYGGHMMAGVWEGILYGILNNDYIGASSSPYQNYIYVTLLVLLFYFIVRQIWDADMALLTILIIPFYNNIKQYGLGMLVCLSLAAYMKKHTYKRALLVWLACVWCALYRLDIGYSFGLACVVTIVVYVVYDRDRIVVKQLASTLGLIVSVFVALWFGICYAKDINPVARLTEFILIGLSNLNWGYYGIGDMEKMAYAWHYMLLPLAVEICLVYVIASKKFRHQAGDERWVILMVLGLSYFTNFSRGLVRHSLVEMQMALIAWSAYVFLAMFAACVLKRELFLPVFMAFVLIMSFMGTTGKIFSGHSIMDTASNELALFVDSWSEKLPVSENDDRELTYWEKLREDKTVVQRVLWDDSTMDRIKELEMIVGKLLDNDETYLDYMNRTFIYSALGRKNPVYVSQSPLQLSGEYVQDKFVESIEKNIDKIPLAVFPMVHEQSSVKLDGIDNVYRYYKVSEFIYNHYEPLCSVGEFAIWCAPEKREKMEDKLLAQEDTGLSIINYGYDAHVEKDENGNVLIKDDAEFHNYELEKLPWIWGELDEKNAADNEEIACLINTEGGYIIGNTVNLDKEKGNYLLVRIDNPHNTASRAELILGTCADSGFDERCKYKFVVLEGTHNYIFRVSSDYFWYTEDINAVKLWYDNGQKIDNADIKILQGD